ncbi:hypothetical protein FD02_GL001848 [Lacticaseibacillus nasuensis JCM 17158]|uniref:Zinc-ribbon domain-containing protein n=3 Tax=Lacticaseibacillus TaxID=2759736 RepID=A0A0R1JRU7_9LACO|nr:hypothetical protein FD02_GL001848 [Lacticaseibacillus nasuensis JCM 17158]
MIPMKYCIKCGAQLPATAEFCPACGTKQPAVSAPAQPAPTVTPAQAAPAQAQPQPSAAVTTPPLTAQGNAGAQAGTAQPAGDIRAAMARAAAAKAKPGDPEWVPYNQYPEHGLINGWRVAFVDLVQPNQCIGRANYWYAYIYAFVLVAICEFGGPIALAIGNLVSISLDWRRLNDIMPNSTLAWCIIIVDIFLTFTSLLNPFIIFGDVAISLFIGLSKTNWQTTGERPVSPAA